MIPQLADLQQWVVQHPLREMPWLLALLILSLSLLVAVLADIVFRRYLHAFTDKTSSELDDILVQELRRPLLLSVVLLGIWLAQVALPLGPGVRHGIAAVLQSVAVLTWAAAGLRLSRQAMDLISQVGTGESLVDSRIQPLLEIGFKGLVVALAAYGLLLAWGVDLTAWLASAGIVGVVVGLAAQESLGNLFAGITIAVDAPYQIGDFIELDDGRCGRVTVIGVRSTRILTEDEVEVTVPNSTMASSSIINWTGGPGDHRRISLSVGVGYGSDPDEVGRILVEAASGIDGVITEHGQYRPSAQLRAFGDSSLDFTLLYWIDVPERRMAILDAVNREIFRRFAAAGVEIPFPRRDLSILSLPPGSPRDPEVPVLRSASGRERDT